MQCLKGRVQEPDYLGTNSGTAFISGVPLGKSRVGASVSQSTKSV